MPSDATLVAVFVATAAAGLLGWAAGQRHITARGQRLATTLGLPGAPDERRASFVRATRVAWRGAGMELLVLQWRAGGWAVAIAIDGHGLADRRVEAWHRPWADVGEGLRGVDDLPGWMAGGPRDVDQALRAAQAHALALADGAWHVRLATDRCVALWPIGVDDARVCQGLVHLRALRDALAAAPAEDDDDA